MFLNHGLEDIIGRNLPQTMPGAHAEERGDASVAATRRQVAVRSLPQASVLCYWGLLC